jgi:hypothetical protein
VAFISSCHSGLGGLLAIDYLLSMIITGKSSGFLFPVVILLLSCGSPDRHQETQAHLTLKEDGESGTISIYRSSGVEPLLVQNAKEGVRPYIHPIIAPDGKGELTEFSPAHHKHQTGLYWGLKELNGRDYFMNWKEDYWRRVSAAIVDGKGTVVKWRTVYHLLDADGSTELAETQTWSFREDNGKYYLDLTWEGKAHQPVTMKKFYVGGLFLRMPWQEGADGEVINAAGQRNGDGEGQRAVWNDLGIKVPGRDDRAHVAILDHPDNKGFPSPWRVDNELGVGPSRQILGDWSIAEGEKEVIRYRMIVYTGNRDDQVIWNIWKKYVCE